MTISRIAGVSCLGVCLLMGVAHAQTAPTFPTVSPDLSFDASQLSQSDYDRFMQCTGHIAGAQAMLQRVSAFMTPEGKAQAQARLSGGQKLMAALNEIRVDLPIMAPHLNQDSGQRAYQAGQRPFDDKAAMPAQAQLDFHMANSAMSSACASLAQTFSGLRSVYIDARRSLED